MEGKLIIAAFISLAALNLVVIAAGIASYRLNKKLDRQAWEERESWENSRGTKP